MLMVNQPNYLTEKQRILDKATDKEGTPRQRAEVEEYEFLSIMNEDELHSTLLALMPVICLEEKPSADKCKYLIGSQSGILMIKTNHIMIRVGGGFASLEDHIK
jgi:hypothetical protein